MNPWYIVGVGLGILSFAIQIGALVVALYQRAALAELKTEIVTNRWADSEASKKYVDERLAAAGKNSGDPQGGRWLRNV
jgi:hypothetical protein